MTMALEESEGDEKRMNAHAGEFKGGLNMGALDDLERIRSKLVSLRDAVWVGSKDLQMRVEGTEERLDLEDLQPSEFHQSQQRRRHVEGPEPEETSYSWTIRSQDGCRIEEVRGGGGGEGI